MRVKLLVPMAGVRAFNVGDEFPCDDAEAVRLIEAGYAVPAAPKIERAVKSAPETRKKK